MNHQMHRELSRLAERLAAQVPPGHVDYISKQAAAQWVIGLLQHVSPKLYIVVDDVEVVGVYTTLSRAAEAMSIIDGSCVEERELDKLPDWPEPREPDMNGPSAAERLARDSFDADRGDALRKERVEERAHHERNLERYNDESGRTP